MFFFIVTYIRFTFLHNYLYRVYCNYPDSQVFRPLRANSEPTASGLLHLAGRARERRCLVLSWQSLHARSAGRGFRGLGSRV